MNIGRILIGKPLETKELSDQAVSKPVGLAVFASDALSSTAYATEEILITLASAVGIGAAASVAGTVFGWSIPIAIAIAILLAVVTISYRQTIYAYPNGGGAYIVARDNLGETPAQVAAAALLTDYILTVAVSISSGVAQITSFPAFRELQPYRVHMAVVVIVFVTLINLRGVKESGRIFAIPTYFFVAMMFLTLVAGLVQLVTGTLGTVDPASVDMFHQETIQNLGLFLILSAFSRGCTALTGIEAISNGITAFKKPRTHNAAITLIWMSSILIVLFLSITLIAHQVAAIPSHTETVISQIARTIHGEASIFYALTLGSTALILLMAANTSYAGFPRLAALAAADGFLPRQLTNRGGRLVFSWGIMMLALFAIVLVIIFNASTTGLIPLYAIGVFLSFTLSQTGMVVRARKTGNLKPGEVVQGMETQLEYDPHWRRHMLISGFGALITFIVMMVFAVTKFTEGAWFILVLIPVLVFIFFRIHHHYKGVAKALSWESVPPDSQPRSVQTVILVDDVHAETVRLVNFAKSLGHPWRAVHVGINPEKTEKVKMKWQKRIGEGDLIVLPSPYRLLAEPIREYVEQIQTEFPGCFVHFIMGHLVMDNFWEQALHQNTAIIFNLSLSQMDDVAVTTVPYQIHHKAIEAAEARKNGDGEEIIVSR